MQDSRRAGQNRSRTVMEQDKQNPALFRKFNQLLFNLVCSPSRDKDDLTRHKKKDRQTLVSRASCVGEVLLGKQTLEKQKM